MITDVHHVGIAVRSLDAAYALYRDALGLSVVKEGVASARGVRSAVLAVGGSYLEILEPVDEESAFARHIAEHGEGCITWRSGRAVWGRRVAGGASWARRWKTGSRG